MSRNIITVAYIAFAIIFEQWWMILLPLVAAVALILAVYASDRLMRGQQ